MLASVDGSRRQNARRKVRAPEEGIGQGPGEAMGWGVPSGSIGSPLLGLECEEARSGFPREIQVGPTTLAGTHFRWGKRISTECGESSRCRAKWKRTQEGKEEEEEREEETIQGRFSGVRVQGKQEGEEGASRQEEQQGAPKEMGRTLSFDPRRQTNLLCIRKGGHPRLMPRAVQEQQGTSLSALPWKPPEQGLPKESGQGWRKRRQEIGAWPQCGPGQCGGGSTTACPAGGRARGDNEGSRAGSSKEVQVPGTVRRAWWLHWGRPTEVRRQRGDDARARLLVHRVGHSQRRALRGRKGVGRECRPHALCTPVQINDKGPSWRQAWQGPSHSERQAARGVGTSKGYRRKPHSGTTHNPYGLCVEERRYVLGGEPVGFIFVAAPSDGAIHKEVPKDLPRSVLLWVRIQETHSYTYSCGLDEASLWHLPGGRRAPAPTRGLVGEDADFFHNPPVEVWRTALAAEYPAHLCWSWAGALEKHVATPEVKENLWKRTMKKEGDNKLVKNDQQVVEEPRSGRERRELENKKALGGLRNPHQAVRRLPKMAKLGARMRVAILQAMMKHAKVLPRGSEADSFGLAKGLPPEMVETAAQLLAKEFGTDIQEQPTPYRAGLVAELVKQGGDPETSVPVWMKEGFPLGIEVPLEINTVFPETMEDTKAVEQSRGFPVLTSVEDVEAASNYKSFEEAGKAAEDELERIAQLGYAIQARNWSEVVTRVGKGAALTKLGCIQKPRPDGTTKTRLIVDMRRSGINGKMEIRQRVVLPRVTEVASAWRHLQARNPGEHITLAVIDFKDAFYTCRLSSQEMKCGSEREKGILYPSSGSIWISMRATVVGSNRSTTHAAGLSTATRDKVAVLCRRPHFGCQWQRCIATAHRPHHGVPVVASPWIRACMEQAAARVQRDLDRI